MPFLAAPPPIAEPVVTEKNRDHWLSEGWFLLLAVARPLRLADALRQRRLTPEQGRRLLMGVVRSVEPTLAAITEALVRGAVRLASWWRSFRDALVPGHFAGAMAVLNDAGEPTPADLQAIADESNRQGAFLARFRGQVQTAQQILDESAVSRSQMYAHAVWAAAMKVRQAAMLRDGHTIGRSVLGVSDHCGGCLSEASKGWTRIENIIPVGERTCLSRCHCYIEYR